MNRYKYPKCNGNQYSSSDKKSNEPCIYCKHDQVELMENNEVKKEKDGETL